MGDEIAVVVRFQSRLIELSFDGLVSTVETLKTTLQEETGVQVTRQKLLGLKLKNGTGPIGDCTKLCDLSLSGKKIMLLGTQEKGLQQMQAQEELAPHFQEAEEDDDIYSQNNNYPEASVKLIDRPEIQDKLAHRVAKANLKELSPPRRGKKCVVLDIDYTFFDLGSTSERPTDLLRPGTVEFFTHVYQNGFDIVIWSATSMKWIDVKLKELGLLDHPEKFKISVCMDYTAMVTVEAASAGIQWTSKKKRTVFDCKPLHVLWERYKEFYTPATTIMLDDLRRNFILNPQHGLVIKPFRKSTTSAKKDEEFFKLRRYFNILATLESFESLDHNGWKKSIADTYYPNNV